MLEKNQIVADAPAGKNPCRAGGVTLRFDAAALLGKPAALARFLGQLVDLVTRGRPSAIRIAGLGEGSAASRNFVRCCEEISRAFGRASVEPEGVELTVSAASMAPDVALAVRSHLLGVGRLNVLIDNAIVADTEGCMRLWRLRCDNNVRPAFWPVAGTGCPLLPAERAMEIDPVAGLQVPQSSAWQIAELDLGSLVDPATGRPGISLARNVARLLEAAEQRHEAERWPTASMCQDAWLNRRVAILPVGIGDVVRRCGMAPDAHETLRTVRGWVGAIRQAAESRSRSLAMHGDLLPAIKECSPCRRVGPGAQRAEWERRWLRAVRHSAVRHRNLIALSPWSLLPRASADIAYVNLLPVLADADVCAFERRISIAHWNINKFSRFYEQALAVLGRATGGVVVAERP